MKANATYSFVLSVPSGAVVSFASKEAGSAVAPQLVVTYKQAAVATTRFGAAFNPHSATRLEQLAGEWGGMQVTRSYDGGSGVKPFLNTYQPMDVAHNAASAYSFKYSPSEVTAGTHDAEVRSFFQGIADNHPVYWTYWHEPDDEIFKNHTFTATAYRDAWAHLRAIHDSVKQARGAAMQTFATFICMEYSMRPNIAPSRPLTGSNGMYPGDAVIDVFGVDSYNAAAPGGVTDAATQFGKVIDFAQQHGKPWAIGELGSIDVTGTANGRATYLKNAISYWKSRGSEPAYVAYFDLVYGGNDYTFDDDAAATKVWHDAVTLGYSAF